MAIDTNPTCRDEYVTFILWGNGFKHAPEILGMIRSHPDLALKKVYLREITDIGRFIDEVYADGATPRAHLREKTKYLRKSNNPNAVVAFALNENPKHALSGRGEFRHRECENIKNLKEEIRERFNPKNPDGSRTEEHVIHASDSEAHAHHLAKVLGYPNGIDDLKNPPDSILPVPHYLAPITHFTIRSIALKNIYAQIIKGTRRSFSAELTDLEHTPHRAFLRGDIAAYQNYIEEFGGIHLTEDYTPERFAKLAENFKYLSPPNELSYIIVREFERGAYRILDGVHRAAILKDAGIEAAPVAVIP